MHRNSPTVIGFCLLIATCCDVSAAPIAVPGIELIFGAAFIAPLLLLLLLGAGFGGFRGAAVGLGIYLSGLAILFFFGTASEAVRMHEVSKGKIAWSDACLNEAGENGHPLPFRAEKMFLIVDQRIRNFWVPLRFDEKRTFPQIEFVPTSPEVLGPNHVLVSIGLIDKPIQGAGSWKIQGFETTVSDSKRRIFAKRINLIRVSDGCFREAEEVAIQRFLRRIVGIAPYPSNESSAEVNEISVTYPVAAVTGPEAGRYEVGKGIGVGTYLPPEWNCILESNVGGPSLIKCPGPDGKLIHDIGLQHRWFLHDLNSTWLLISNPDSTNHVNGGFLDRLIVEERTRSGHPYRKWFIRFPRINVTGSYAIGDVRMTSDQLELVWLFNWRKSGGSNAGLGYYTERYVMTVPTGKALVAAQPIIPPDAAR